LAKEWLAKTLTNLGFEPLEAEIYTYLSLNGCQKASAIAEGIGICKRYVYCTLEKLKKRKIVAKTGSPRAYFSVVPFDILLDFIVKSNLQEARQIERDKNNLVALWRSWVEKNKAM
jgi:sugar-specific transcriptional regulator TrmB